MSVSKPSSDFFKTTLTTAFGTLGMAVGESASDVALAAGIAYDKICANITEALNTPTPPDGGYFASPYYRGF